MGKEIDSSTNGSHLYQETKERLATHGRGKYTNLHFSFLWECSLNHDLVLLPPQHALSWAELYEHEREENSAYVTVISHEKPASIDGFPQRLTEAEVISKVQLVDKRQGHDS